MANPMQNPTVQLEHILRDPTMFLHPKLSAPYCITLSKNPPPYLNANLEDVLQYVKHEPFIGIEEFATIQIHKDRNEAHRHWTIQRGLDSKFFMHPRRYVKVLATSFEYHVLIFDNIIRDFRVWKEAHANGQVSDQVMWELVKKIGRIFLYLSSEIQPPRSHGNLLRGAGVRADLQVFFFNLGAANSYRKDVREFEGMLTSIELNMQNVDLKRLVNRWKSFFSNSCLAPNPTPVQGSALYTALNPDHVKLIFNYPTVWNDDDYLRFLANMYKLCKDKCNNNRKSNLLRNRVFETVLYSRYPQWDVPVTATTSALNEVYQFGLNNRSYTRFDRATRTRVLLPASIVIFAHNCVKHFVEGAQTYNNWLLANINNPNFPANQHQPMPEFKSSDILAEIRKEFSYLIEDIYEAFHQALAKGYSHHIFTVSEILTGRL